MPQSSPPVILWFRRDLRLYDNQALAAAAASGRPVIPLFIKDPIVDAMGAAPKWRLGLSIADFAARLEALGTRLILREGKAAEVLDQIIAETGADTLHYTRDLTPEAIARDTTIKSAFKARDLTVESHGGAVLFDPWTVAPATAPFYKVFTPFWRNVRGRDPGEPVAAPSSLRAPDAWPPSDDLGSWALGTAMRRGTSVVAQHVSVGEAAADARLAAFLAGPVGSYAADRDRMDLAATSSLSENLAYGEISPRVIWYAGWRAAHDGQPGAETFVKELVWRDFSYHLMFHTPQIASANWRPQWDQFPWAGDSDAAMRWRQGMTGEPVIDAAMRELYVTGRMHNRARMLVASYLTKHLMTHWKIGLDWFADCLVDWDPAANAMGWQWAAGSGPDASPFFRIFNPATQADKFDPKGAYRARFLGKGADAAAFFEAIPKRWALSPSDTPMTPIVDLKDGRERALAAYSALRAAPAAAE